RPEWVAALREYQVHRWKDHSPVAVENLIKAFSELSADDVLVLVGGEFALRREAGHDPTAAEYQVRFPQFADQLELVLALVGQSTTAKDQSAPTPIPAAVAPPAVPGYDTLQGLGRGGMGVVSLARHVAANRLVALKMILGGAHAGETERLRFRT